MTDDMLRAPAEVKYAEELDWLESVDDGPKPFSWRLSARRWSGCSSSAPSAPTAWTARSPQKWFGDRSFVERSHRHAGLRPRPAADRRPRHRQELAGRAAGRRDLPQLHARRAGHRRHHRGPHQVLVERLHGHRQGPVPRVDDPLADHDGDGAAA